jgi:hypothetical protein
VLYLRHLIIYLIFEKKTVVGTSTRSKAISTGARSRGRGRGRGPSTGRYRTMLHEVDEEMPPGFL